MPRQSTETPYDYENRVVTEMYGRKACKCRTSIGGPWSLPCTLQRKHDGPCIHDSMGTLLKLRDAGRPTDSMYDPSSKPPVADKPIDPPPVPHAGGFGQN